MGRQKETGATKLIPVDFIHDPENMMRDEDQDTEDLRELGNSMKDHGQINPVSVRWKNERYILLAGHRRLRAALLVGMERLECKVFECDDEGAMFIRWDENEKRLQNNIAEEARFIAEMLATVQCTQTELSKKLGKSSAYVSQRLSLLEGPPDILEAVRQRVISFDVARELLLFPTKELASIYLKYAVDGGASAKIVRRWREDANVQMTMVQEAEAESPAGEQVPWNPARKIMYCECCRNSYALSELVYLRLCYECEGKIKANPEVRHA